MLRLIGYAIQFALVVGTLSYLVERESWSGGELLARSEVFSGFWLAIFLFGGIGAVVVLFIVIRPLLAILVRTTTVVVREPSPVRTLRSSRRTGLFQVAAVALIAAVGWHLTQMFWDLPEAWRSSLATAVSLGFIASITGSRLSGTWSFFVARVYLWFSRRTPLRLMRFLEDATQRGVLRQAGPVYEFRHAKLQAYLAGRGRLPGRPGTTPPTMQVRRVASGHDGAVGVGF